MIEERVDYCDYRATIHYHNIHAFKSTQIDMIIRCDSGPTQLDTQVCHWCLRFRRCNAAYKMHLLASLVVPSVKRCTRSNLAS